ncbi:MAG: FeoB-associated Cys-rich membrane protein [Oscillospiraceae bacterium]|jgi:ABC-type sulfate transport system permease component|nr:FeoB-associated Cys-rich membrane protein [Oscillospiraceae bacterium]
MAAILGTAFVGTILAIIVALIIVSMVRRRVRAKQSGCACSCASCPYAAGCGKAANG